MRLVYRIEGPTGFGPYSSDVSLPNSLFWGATHPSPWNTEEKALEWSYHVDCRNWFFGFISIRQLVRWFNKETREIISKRAEFKLVVYEVDNYYVRHSNTQAIFKKEAAKRIFERPLYARNHPAQTSPKAEEAVGES